MLNRLLSACDWKRAEEENNFRPWRNRPTDGSEIARGKNEPSARMKKEEQLSESVNRRKTAEGEKCRMAVVLFRRSDGEGGIGLAEVRRRRVRAQIGLV